MSKSSDFEKDYNEFTEKYKDSKLHHYQDQPEFSKYERCLEIMSRVVAVAGIGILVLALLYAVNFMFTILNTL